ncbi:flavin reductase family protein [Pseudoroseicyclus aestuarii]|uniref:Flavin reductase (DIM6/NTAB) family NADH-FMN oxidoreductase RutF n=1 Tax=Pseudoroseicyclus aestuarii TaxID=1795041 RepID=A0A318STC2_9RHOB|nr:flavin reductase family protein [Pseudoroseicyclus aestuarii]PYE81367.1 flavin reductase (DIM6/NTAB) family NADH-FMN oxidoreductase RutF [Pseudoroseicyclus aestuarii]
MTIAVRDIDPRALRECCGRFATGVTVVTTRTAAGDHGMTISAFMSVSLTPPLVCISVGRGARLLPKLRGSGRFAINILSEDMRAHALHFAGRPEAALNDPFEDRHGLPILRDAAAVLVADVARTVEAGDHVLVLGAVRHLEHRPGARPLLHHAGQFGGIAAQAR